MKLSTVAVTLVLCAILLFVAAGYGVGWWRTTSRWEAEAAAAVDSARAARVRARSLERIADAERARADSAEAVADSARNAARVAIARGDAALERADSISHLLQPRLAEIAADSVPAAALPYVARRDTVISLLRTAVDELRDVADARAAAIAKLTHESGALRASLAARTAEADALRRANAVLATSLDSAVAVLDRRPKPRPWWMPRIGAGAFAGACTGADVCAGVGPTVSWDIRIR